MPTITNNGGRIAVLFPANTVEAQLYTVPSATSIDAVLRIHNKDTLPSTFSVAHCVAGQGNVNALDTDWLFSDAPIEAKQTIEISIHAGATETIRVKSGTSSKVNFHLSGNRKVLS